MTLSSQISRLSGDGDGEGVTTKLHAGWQRCTIGDIFKVTTGGTPSRKSAAFFDGDVPWIKTGEVQNGDIFEAGEHITTDALEQSSAKLFPAGTLLIALYGEGKTRGQVGRLMIEAATNQACAALINTSLGEVTRRFVFFYLLSQYFEFRARSVGGNQPNLSVGLIRSWPMSIAPLAEQKRIVAKVDEVLARVTAARQRLAKVPTILKRFRQSVLAAACSGRLTADWREANGLSDEWTTTTLGEVGEVSGGLTKNSRRATLALKVPFLRVANVYSNRLDLSEVHQIGVTEAEFARTRLVKGDLLFVEGNGSVDQIGRAARWDGKIEDCAHQNHLIRFRSGPELIPSFALFAMMSPQGREQLVSQAISSAGLHSLSISKVAAAELPLPSVREQEEVVRRVAGLVSLADRVEAKLTAGSLKAEKLVQATLAKAFRGELVPTEAEVAEQEGRDYETAEALLARIKFGVTASTPRSRPALPAVDVFRTDLFEDADGSEHDGVQGIAGNLGVLRRRWTTASPATLKFDGALAEAFRKTCDTNSPDRVVADPELHHAFVEQCRKLGLENPEFDLCFSLLNMRKGNDLKGLDSARKPVMGQWRYAAASEIAARVIHWRHGLTVDRILCHPTFVEEFEQVARSITPGYSSFEYRWAALGCRKVGHKAAQGVVDRLRWSDPVSFAALGDLPDAKGVYALRDRQHEADCLFVCGTKSISQSIAAQTNLGSQNLFGDGLWQPDPQHLVWTYAKTSTGAADRHGIVNVLISQWSPILNVPRAA